jgi:hypothetical protein
MNGSLSKRFSNYSRLMELETKAKMNNLEASKNSVIMLCEWCRKPDEETLSWISNWVEAGLLSLEIYQKRVARAYHQLFHHL